MKKFVKVVAGSLWALPVLAMAQVNTSYINSLLNGAKGILDQLVVLLIALAVVWFIWNVVVFTMSEGDDPKREKAKNQMVWGIIAIAVIVSIWGLVAILQNIFDVKSTGAGNVGRLLPN